MAREAISPQQRPRRIIKTSSLDRSAAALGYDVPCYSPLKGFVNKENGGIVFKRSKIAGAEMEVPCGQCLGCRHDHAQTWATRIMHEAHEHDENCFITLTYDNEHLPGFRGDDTVPMSLVKEDFTKFMKRLRKRIYPKQIRYYMCAEYGDESQRPHYHACIFGFYPQDKEVLSVNADYSLHASDMIADAWGMGFITVGALTFESAAYCARYVLKKVNGRLADDWYARLDEDTGEIYWLLPEYTRMSRGKTCKKHRGMEYQLDCPNCSRAIGRDFYEKYKHDFFPSDECPIPGKGVLNKIPRYYETILRSDSECDHAAIKLARQEFRKRHTNEYSPNRLYQKYRVKKAQIELSKRGKV